MDCIGCTMPRSMARDSVVIISASRMSPLCCCRSTCLAPIQWAQYSSWRQTIRPAKEGNIDETDSRVSVNLEQALACCRAAQPQLPPGSVGPECLFDHGRAQLAERGTK